MVTGDRTRYLICYWFCQHRSWHIESLSKGQTHSDMDETVVSELITMLPVIAGICTELGNISSKFAISLRYYILQELVTLGESVHS